MAVLPIPNSYSTEEQREIIEESIKMNTTFNLFNCFYSGNRLKCIKYSEDAFYRKRIGQQDFEQRFLEAMIAKKLINERPIDERLEIFRKLKIDLSDRISGNYFDRLEETIIPNPFNDNKLCSPWGKISEEERGEIIRYERETIEDFIKTFLG